MKNSDYKYYLGFKFKDNITSLVSLIIFAAICAFFYFQNIGAYIFVFAFVIITAILVLIGFYRTFFKKILIYDDGFLHQTSPFKKEFYYDNEIEDAWISDKRQANGITVHYFNYKAKDGRKGKYYFPPYLYDYADYLAERIKGEDVTDYENHLDS
ncbi:MAG: TMEM14 family protein [Eubacterium sp.]